MLIFKPSQNFWIRVLVYLLDIREKTRSLAYLKDIRIGKIPIEIKVRIPLMLYNLAMESHPITAEQTRPR